MVCFSAPCYPSGCSDCRRNLRTLAAYNVWLIDIFEGKGRKGKSTLVLLLGIEFSHRGWTVYAAIHPAARACQGRHPGGSGHRPVYGAGEGRVKCDAGDLNVGLGLFATAHRSERVDQITLRWGGDVVGGGAVNAGGEEVMSRPQGSFAAQTCWSTRMGLPCSSLLF